MRRSIRSSLSVALLTTCFIGGGVFAFDPKDDDGLEAAREKAEASLQHTFSNFEFYSFKPSMIEGIYQIDTGDRMIYYSPAANVILFGEMWDHLGNNLSAAALSVAAQERMTGFDLTSALEFGPEDGPLLTEYSNPHCGYCQQLHGYLDQKQRDDGIEVRRRIIFAVGHSRPAQDAAEHILCSDNPEQAFSEIYQRRNTGPLIRCDEGRKRVLQHIEITRAAGVQGTPTLVVDGEFIRGFHQERIEEFLQQASNKGE